MLLLVNYSVLNFHELRERRGSACCAKGEKSAGEGDNKSLFTVQCKTLWNMKD